MLLADEEAYINLLAKKGRFMNISDRLMKLAATQKSLKKQLPHQVSNLVHKYAANNEVSFKIDSNYVYLYGSLGDPRSKRVLHEEIDALIGVRGINNEIRIKSR